MNKGAKSSPTQNKIAKYYGAEYARKLEEVLAAAAKPVAANYRSIEHTIQDVRRSYDDPDQLDEIQAAITELRGRVELHAKQMQEVGDAATVEIARLVRKVEESEVRSGRRFWKGLLYSAPIGFIMGIVVSLIGFS